LVLVVGIIYGLGWLYYYYTDGFTIENISTVLPYNPNLDVHTLSARDSEQLKLILDQPYTYLGKGCQAYVFESQDHKYVIKFFKYQRYKLKPWLAYFPALPAIVKYRQQKLDHKQKKLERFFMSWKVAFDHLKKETGLLYVHLNTTQNLLKPLIIY